jgi:PBP1b-binding outer membrane lipoprotein LpoB
MKKTLLKILFIPLLFSGCVSEREIVYRSVYFADTNGVTTIYFPQSMEKDLKTPHDEERWRHIAADGSDEYPYCR